MRLIDGEALEKFLSAAEIEATERKKYVFAGALNVIQGNVRNFPTIEPEPHWIPCSERLPDIKENHVSEPCIVYCENGAYGFAELEENIFGQVGWDCEREDEFHEPLLGKVLAWMPLPEPYQSQEK